MTKQRKFEVSAKWMKACGQGDAAAVFPVLKVETNMIGRYGMDAFVTVERPDGPWIVAAGRGKFVD